MRTLNLINENKELSDDRIKMFKMRMDQQAKDIQEQISELKNLICQKEINEKKYKKYLKNYNKFESHAFLPSYFLKCDSKRFCNVYDYCNTFIRKFLDKRWRKNRKDFQRPL